MLRIITNDTQFRLEMERMMLILCLDELRGTSSGDKDSMPSTTLQEMLQSLDAARRDLIDMSTPMAFDLEGHCRKTVAFATTKMVICNWSGMYRVQSGTQEARMVHPERSRPLGDRNSFSARPWLVIVIKLHGQREWVGLKSTAADVTRHNTTLAPHGVISNGNFLGSLRSIRP